MMRWPGGPPPGHPGKPRLPRWQTKALLRAMSSPVPSAFSDKENAAAYDDRFAKMAPMRDALHLVAGAVLAELPTDARILCVGAGTGSELLAFARRFPEWHFTAVDPAAAMLEICEKKAVKEGISDRCVFHAGYLDSLPPGEGFHAATSILVSQFILDWGARRGFFGEIAKRLLPDGLLVSADLSADLASEEYQTELEVWLNIFRYTGMDPEMVGRLREAYGRDVAVSRRDEIEALIASAGFEQPVHFLQTSLIHAWFAKLA